MLENKAGVRNTLEVSRIKSYAQWLKIHYLDPHFEAEEHYIFPVLGNDHELVKRALKEHRRLKRLFSQDTEIEIALNIASAEQLADIEKHHYGIQFSNDYWQDHLWKN